MKIIFHRLAERELTDAFWYYEDRSDGLGSSFLDHVQRSARLLLSFPRSAPLVRQVGDVSIRKRALPKFPYDLFFTFDEDSLFILAVAHQKRRPYYWIERVRDL